MRRKWAWGSGDQVPLDTLNHIAELLKDWFNLSDWKITCEIKTLQGNDAAQVCIDAVYLTAVITVDSQCVEHDDMLWSYMIHEFIHILHAEFELFERHMQLSGAERAMYINYMERAVVRTERIITGLLKDAGRIPK